MIQASFSLRGRNLDVWLRETPHNAMCRNVRCAHDEILLLTSETASYATQIGFTATTKETEEISISIISAIRFTPIPPKQGIADGFLASYKVVRIGLDKDLDGWRSERGKANKYGRDRRSRIQRRRF